MKRVSQLHPDGCGVACVAMIAGVGYHEARKTFHKDEKTGQSTTDVRQALAKFDVACARRLVRLPSGHYRNLKQDAILRTRTRSDGDSHWIVWDAKRKKFLDPEPNKEVRYAKPPVTSFLAVRRK
jgi:hypothetical protein